ncbi:MAG: RusA family crossover junction endodeoxyribonuclease [Pseudomonadota bacterium]
MTHTVRFEIPGKPFAKQRPRMTRQGRAYTPKATVSFESVVRQLAALHFSEPLRGPVHVSVCAVFEIPKSWSKARRDAAVDGFHTSRPDADNIRKAILDGMNRIAYEDDSQVASGFDQKIYGSEAKTIVEVTALHADAWHLRPQVRL